MALEQRGDIVQSTGNSQLQNRRSCAGQTKPFNITKRQVFEAYKQVKAKGGSAGIDEQSLQDFDADLRNNLYKLWNRLTSGSYHPPAVLRVNIPKADGTLRPLGIPTVKDRIAQTVVKNAIEPKIDRYFHPDSYGYRPGKSAHMAVAATKRRCWQRPWVLDMDIKSYFNTIDHTLLLRAIHKHVNEKWQLLYIERWMRAPVRHPDGRLEESDKGVPQGGVISPLLANLYLHYAFDLWMTRHWSRVTFERYADDIICHCDSESEAQTLKQALSVRFQSCGLSLHPEKTKIVYCKSSYYRKSYADVTFDFLGFTFRPRQSRSCYGNLMMGFTPAISQNAAKRIRHQMGTWQLPRKQALDLVDLAEQVKAEVRGWANYFGRFGKGELRRVLFHLDEHIIRWAQRKFIKLRRRKRTLIWLHRVRKERPSLFAHWCL